LTSEPRCLPGHYELSVNDTFKDRVLVVAHGRQQTAKEALVLIGGVLQLRL
jgi:hypothetical protein